MVYLDNGVSQQYFVAQWNSKGVAAMTTAQKKAREDETRRREEWYQRGFVSGVYSWEDYPEANNVSRRKISVCKSSPAGALLSGFRVGRASRNYAQ
jgi:hypothetical protein